VSDELRKVSLPILSQEECDEAGYAVDRITENMFCAGYLLEGARDACFVSVKIKLIISLKKTRKCIRNIYNIEPILKFN